MMTPDFDAVVLLSGGVYSMVLLHRATNPVALFVNYGQAAAAKERKAAHALASKRACRFHSMEVGGFSTWTAYNNSVVYGRNLMLISLGVNLARSYGAPEVWIGCHGDDNRDYPDCRPEFIEAQNRINRSAYLVGVRAPLMTQSRASFIAEARHYGSMDLTWSCYSPTSGGNPCGTCNSCKQPK